MGQCVCIILSMYCMCVDSSWAYIWEWDIFIYPIHSCRSNPYFLYYSLIGVEDWSLRLNEFYLSHRWLQPSKPPTQSNITSVRCCLADPSIWTPAAVKLDLDRSLCEDFCRFLAWIKDGMWWKHTQKKLIYMSGSLGFCLKLKHPECNWWLERKCFYAM